MPNRTTVQPQKAQPAPFISPKQAFVQSLAWSIPITWFDRQGLYRLDDDRAAVLTLEIQSTIGSYSGFQVEIVSKIRGRLFQKYFDFNDYLHSGQRSDNRSDYEGGFVVHAESCDWNWYIAIPTSTKPFTQAVERWVEHFH